MNNYGLKQLSYEESIDINGGIVGSILVGCMIVYGLGFTVGKWIWGSDKDSESAS